jgi:hypothetical protein
MRKGILIAGLMLFIISLLPQSMFCQEKLTISAKIWKYTSICDFKDPDHSSGYSIKPTTEKVTIEVTDCKAFEKKHGQPPAVAVTLKNSDQAPMDVAIDKELVEVTLTDKDNQTIKALAKRFMVEGPMGGKKMEFITKADASYAIKLAPGEEVNIVYLFAKASAGDTLKISNLKPTKIEASKTE